MNRNIILTLIKEADNVEQQIDIGLKYIISTHNNSETYFHNYYAMSAKLFYLGVVNYKPILHKAYLEHKIKNILLQKNTNMTTGIIVARMQAPYLHNGYKYLIETIKGTVDNIVIVLGSSSISFTDKNPLSYEIRKEMVKEEYPFMLFEEIIDCPGNNKQWSKNLDKIVQKYDNPILFGSRDSFIQSYSGVYITKMIECEHQTSSTAIRTAIGNMKANINKDVRIGIIHAVQNRYPIVYSTVDIAVVFGLEILLVKKPGHNKYCLVGGFIDKDDLNTMSAAFRELHEELKNFELQTSLEYVGSFKINDERYEGTKDSIMTTLYVGTPKEKENIILADDLEGGESKWFDIDTFDITLLEDKHHVLFINLKKHLYA